MAGSPNKPWNTPHTIETDTTQRVRVLEVQREVADLAIERLNNKVDILDDKFDIATKETSIHLSSISASIRDLKSELLNKELDALRKKHENELEEVKEESETSAKVKMMWTGIGVIMTALVAVLISIFKTRFGG